MEKLIYVDDNLPGISRKGAGKGWAYYDAKGNLIRDLKEKARLNAVALPPAYLEAWYCPAPNGHILATGIDAKGRKQYRYHPDFRSMREGEKFDRCLAFGKLLPLVRKRVDDALAGNDLSRERVLAGVIRLLDLGFVRVGNSSYAKTNKSFGATTLRRRHVDVDGETVHLHFRGKSGQERDLTVADEALAETIEELNELPGHELFQYIDDEGARQNISSGDVNQYLRDTMGEDFTAKNFRTWHASVLAFGFLADQRAKPPLNALLEEVSDRLGNTPAVARNSYIHPAVIDIHSCYNEWRSALKLPRNTKYQSREERGLIQLLERAPSAEELLATAH